MKIGSKVKLNRVGIKFLCVRRQEFIEEKMYPNTTKLYEELLTLSDKLIGIVKYIGGYTGMVEVSFPLFSGRVSIKQEHLAVVE